LKHKNKVFEIKKEITPFEGGQKSNKSLFLFSGRNNYCKNDDKSGKNDYICN